MSIRRLRRLMSIGEPVAIPQSLIDKLKPFGPHFIKVAKPVPGDTKSGKNAVERAWQDHPYEADDSSLQEWVTHGNNYGVTAGEGIAQVDLDTKEAQAKFKKMVNTFEVKSGRISGEGLHSYIRTDATENGIIFDDAGRQVGNVQVRNKFVVGPGCHHNSGGVYHIINDVPFAWVPKRLLEEIFGDKLKWTDQIRNQDVEEAEDQKSLMKIDIPMGLIVDLTKLKQRGDEYQGPHPIHGSTTGINFCVDVKQNVWHCFRCNSGGGGLMWIAVKHGLLQCHEAQKGALRGIKFIEAVKCAREDGINIKMPEETLEPDVERFFEKMRNGELKFIPAYLSKELMKEACYFTRKSDGITFQYNPKNGIYEMVFDIEIGHEIAKKLGKHYSFNRERETITHLKRETLKEIPPLSENLIAVKNGILDINTRELRSFSPDYFVVNALPWAYDPEANCPANKLFISQVVSKGDGEMLQEFLGYCLQPSCRLEKALMLIGIGSNGKTVMLKTWTALLGESNVSNIPLQELAVDRYALADLFGKLANICDDLPNLALKDAGVFKRLTTGARISAQHKFKDRFEYNNTAKQAFATNSPPEPPEDSDAYFRRWLAANFPNQFTASSNPPCDPDLLAKLTTPEEMSGLLNWALDGLQRLRKRGRFTTSETIEGMRERYMLLSNPQKAFVDEYLTTSFKGESTAVGKDEVYLKFVEFCRKNNLPAVAKNTFASHLPTLIICQGTRNTWKGIRFRTDEEINEAFEE